ncbi:hypothetical protein NN561_013457 [Cricetulus griseus]
MSGSQLQAAMVLLLLLQSVQSVYIKYDGFQVKLESVKKLSELEKQQTSEPQLKTSGLLPAVCHDPALPLDLQPVCASQEAASIFKALSLFSLYVWVSCLHRFRCIVCMPGDFGGQKRESDPVELELQMILSFRAGTGNQAWVFYKSS